MIAQREKSLFYRALILSAVDQDFDNNPIEEKEDSLFEESSLQRRTELRL